MGEIVRVREQGPLFLGLDIRGKEFGLVCDGTLIEVVSGPHVKLTGTCALYFVRVGDMADRNVAGKKGFLSVTENELGHPHGLVVPVPTEASATVPAPVVDAVVEYDQTHAINVLEAKNVELRKELADAKKSLACREEQITTLKAEAQTRLDRLDELYRERDGARHERDEHQASLNKLGSEYAELRARNDANAEEYRKVKAELDKECAALSKLANTARDMQNDRRAAQALADERLKIIDADTQEKNRLREERGHWERAACDRLREREAFASQNADLRRELKTTTCIAVERAREIERLHTRIADSYNPFAREEQRAMTEQAAPKFTDRPIVKTLTADAEAAAWRLAGSQFVKTTRAPLVGLLTRHLAPDGDDALRARIAVFLETELGTSLLAAVLSMGLSAMPANGSQVPERLARELRIRSMAGASEVVADALLGPLREVMALYLKDVAPMLPATPATLGEGTGIRSEVVDAEHATVTK